MLLEKEFYVQGKVNG